MMDIYIRLAIIFVCSFIGVYLMNKHQDRKIRLARESFEEMMKSRGLSLEPLDKGEKK